MKACTKIQVMGAFRENFGFFGIYLPVKGGLCDGKSCD